MKNITYEQLLEISSWGLFSFAIKKGSICDPRLDKIYKKAVKGAEYEGIYVGSPGRDIYYMLPYLTDDQIEEVSIVINDKFPKTPPGNHVNIAAFVRFVYGQFEKQGVLRSNKDFERMKEEKIDLTLPRKFLSSLFNKFEADNNFYGMSILSEMEAHRLGDEAILHNNINKLNEMEEEYKKVVKYASKCNSYKQLFTPYYWAFKYLLKFKDMERASKYAFMTIKNADKYCPDARPGYVTKLSDCVIYVQKYEKNKWDTFRARYKNSKNKCVRKVFRKIGK